MSKALPVTGATGKQGGGVVDAVLELPNASGYTILGIIRTANSSSATALAKKSPGIKLVDGSLDDPEAIFKTATATTKATVSGAFSV
ncbi:MAG: hypothetical protein M1836_006660 [Candelina mexicana]|nr:MAG: hypothetical protein M1836_006660 [Candelina mexicana]